MELKEFVIHEDSLPTAAAAADVSGGQQQNGQQNCSKLRSSTLHQGELLLKKKIQQGYAYSVIFFWALALPFAFVFLPMPKWMQSSAV
jgi:hypothetical protein